MIDAYSMLFFSHPEENSTRTSATQRVSTDSKGQYEPPAPGNKWDTVTSRGSSASVAIDVPSRVVMPVTLPNQADSGGAATGKKNPLNGKPPAANKAVQLTPAATSLNSGASAGAVVCSYGSGVNAGAIASSVGSAAGKNPKNLLNGKPVAAAGSGPNAGTITVRVFAKS